MARAARVRNERGAGERLRAELLAAADEILDRTGDPAAVTVRGVAAAVGVAPNAVYLHFADREALLDDVAIARLEACTAAIREAVADIDDPLEALYIGHETYCRLALERPGHYRLLFRNVLHPTRAEDAERLAAAGGAYFQTCIDCCQAVIDSGQFPPVDPVELAGAVWALEHGWCEISLAAGLGQMLVPAPRQALAVLLAAGSRGAVSGQGG